LIHPTNPSKKVFVFSCKNPVSATSILLAVGPFECLDIPGWGQTSQQLDSAVPDTDEMEKQENRLFGGGRTFFLAGRKSQVENTVEFLHQVCSLHAYS
jgi:hypothetical protein